MITFLAEETLAGCAACLDRQRLGRQRSEILWVLRSLEQGRAPSMPIVRLWRGHADVLATLGLYVCSEWRARGYRDEQYPLMMNYWSASKKRGSRLRLPGWWGGPIHDSHKAMLVHKDPQFYGPKWPDIAWDWTPAYFWPE